MYAGDLITRIFLGSFLAMLFSIVLFALCIFFAGKIIGMRDNRFRTAFEAALVAFVAGIAVSMLGYIHPLILLGVQFFASLAAVSYFYKTDYWRAFGLVIIGTIIFMIIEWMFAPWILF